MCGNKRRQARMSAYGRCGSRNYDSSYSTGASLSTIIGTLQQMKISPPKELYPDPSTTVRSARPGGQTSGVILAELSDDKTFEAQQDVFNSEQLPSYEESTTPRALPIISPPVSENYSAPPPLTKSISGTQIMISNLEQFNFGLDKYRRGACGGRGTAKRAAKALIKDLVDQELERRSFENTHLRKGERKQVRRELKPVKQMMKDAVREAKMDRRDRWLSS